MCPDAVLRAGRSFMPGDWLEAGCCDFVPETGLTDERIRKQELRWEVMP